MARGLMILGTHSNAGKSALATGFCRLLSRRGFSVAPFKAQNMSNNAGVTAGGGEMGRAQIVQALAAGVKPHTDMNPVLLKPESDCRSQVVLRGKVFGHIDAANWGQIRLRLWDAVRESYDHLASRHDVVILEGAGSPAEINLKAMDIVNLRMARHADADCLLVGDIDRGGVFAALAGTMLLLDPDERRQIRGFIINKFRGDPGLLGDGLERLREIAYGVRTLGVVPFLPYLDLPAEDAVVAEEGSYDRSKFTCDIAVLQFPHLANFDEFDALRSEPDVRLRFVVDADAIGRPDAVILPGSKGAIRDLRWLRQRRLDSAVRSAHASGAAVVGICGGFQMLGRELRDPLGVEVAEGDGETGLGLLAVSTSYGEEKHTHRSAINTHTGESLAGYEIHHGDTEYDPDAAAFARIVARDGVAVDVADGAVSSDGRVWGTYLHGLFEHAAFRQQWLRRLGWRGVPSAANSKSEGDRVAASADRLADALEEAVGWPSISALVRC